jgi:hypothetical protein
MSALSGTLDQMAVRSNDHQRPVSAAYDSRCGRIPTEQAVV